MKNLLVALGIDLLLTFIIYVVWYIPMFDAISGIPLVGLAIAVSLWLSLLVVYAIMFLPSYALGYGLIWIASRLIQK